MSKEGGAGKYQFLWPFGRQIETLIRIFPIKLKKLITNNYGGSRARHYEN